MIQAVHFAKILYAFALDKESCFRGWVYNTYCWNRNYR